MNTDFDDDYVDSIIAKFFADENGVEIILDSMIDDDDFCTDELDDIEEPTDDELDAIESASV